MSGKRRILIFFDEETTSSLRVAREAYMEGVHVGFGRRICTDASSKPLPITTVLSAVFSSPWHKSDGQNCVAPAMERFSSEFWCGGRRNTRVFQGRQAGNHRKSPMSGGTDPFHVCPCFLPVNLVFVAAFAALVVSFPGTCPGKDGLVFGRRDNRQSLFSPRAPLSEKTGDNVLTLQNVHSSKANIKVFRALPEKPSELLHFSL